jgi:fatty-acyl-CoA synthase
LIIRGGENISPKEIEDFYLAHEGIRDVQVIGTHCDRLIEDVTAVIIPEKLEIM